MNFIALAVLFAVTATTSPAPEPQPLAETVYLGADCSRPFTVSLTDDVLTECEVEGSAPELD